MLESHLKAKKLVPSPSQYTIAAELGTHQRQNPMTTKSPRVMEAEVIQKNQKKYGFPGVGKYSLQHKPRIMLGASDKGERIGVISEA